MFSILTFCSCTEPPVYQTADPSLAAKVNGEPIFIQDIDREQQENEATREEALNRLIDNKLLYEKLESENWKMTDDEVKASYKSLLRGLYPDSYQEGDEDAVTTEQLQDLREQFLITRYKDKLGDSLEGILQQLRSQAKIEYYHSFSQTALPS